MGPVSSEMHFEYFAAWISFALNIKKTLFEKCSIGASNNVVLSVRTVSVFSRKNIVFCEQDS